MSYFGSEMLFALSTVPITLPGGSEKKSGRVLEDPGLTTKFMSHKLAEQPRLPSMPASLLLQAPRGPSQDQSDKILLDEPHLHAM